MKKVSTAASRQSRNVSHQQQLTIGLDLGDCNSWYRVVDEGGQIQLEQRVRPMRKRCPKALYPVRLRVPRGKKVSCVCNTGRNPSL